MDVLSMLNKSVITLQFPIFICLGGDIRFTEESKQGSIFILTRRMDSIKGFIMYCSMMARKYRLPLLQVKSPTRQWVETGNLTF